MAIDDLIRLVLSASVLGLIGAISTWARRRRIREALDRELERILG
jgi:hypothetical protein